MRWVITLLLILVLIVLVILYQQQINEGFLSGTDVQLLTSKPYYTWYDYLTNIRRYPYGGRYPYGRGYPYGRRYYYQFNENPEYSYFGRPYPFYQPYYY